MSPRIYSKPSLQTPAVKRRVAFTFSDGRRMTLIYMRDATVNAYIAGVADTLWTYRRHCGEGMFPASGDMTHAEWCVIGEAFRRDLEGAIQ